MIRCNQMDLDKMAAARGWVKDKEYADVTLYRNGDDRLWIPTNTEYSGYQHYMKNATDKLLGYL